MYKLDVLMLEYVLCLVYKSQIDWLFSWWRPKLRYKKEKKFRFRLFQDINVFVYVNQHRLRAQETAENVEKHRLIRNEARFSN